MVSVNPKESTELKKRYKNYDNKLHFTVVSQQLAQDKRLSWKARGLYLYLASNSHTWKFHLSKIIDQSSKDGRASTRSALQELIKYHYVKWVQLWSKGHFQSTQLTLYYVPSDRDDIKYSGIQKAVCRKPANRKPVNRKTDNRKSAPNKYQGKQIPTKTNINRQSVGSLSVNNSLSNKYSEREPSNQTKGLNEKEKTLLNDFKERFSNVAISYRLIQYIKQWSDTITHSKAGNYYKLLHCMDVAKRNCGNDNPNTIGSYINKCFTNPMKPKHIQSIDRVMKVFNQIYPGQYDRASIYPHVKHWLDNHSVSDVVATIHNSNTMESAISRDVDDVSITDYLDKTLN